eukprot:687956_1
MKLTWFAANVVVVALTFQFLVQSVTLSGLASTFWKCTVCAFERNDPSSSKCAFCKEENAAFVLPHTCEPSNAGSGDYTDDIISTEKDKTDGSTTGDDIVTINLVDGKKGSDDYTDDIISTEKDKTDGSTTGDDAVTINLVTDKEGTNEGSRESTATLFFCFVLFICLAILGGVQFAIFKHHRTVYQGFEDAHLIEDNDNPETIIEVEEEEGHRLPPDSRDYATEVCRSVCLGAVCCAAWIIVPYYHWKERRQRRRENNLTRSQELLQKLYW